MVLPIRPVLEKDAVPLFGAQLCIGERHPMASVDRVEVFDERLPLPEVDCVECLYHDVPYVRLRTLWVRM